MGMMRMKFREVVWLHEFKREFKSLSKRHATLEEDLAVFIETAAFVFHKLELDTGIVRIEGLGRTRLPVFKAKKFACRSLKGKGARSGIRVIYAFDKDQDRIELIEIYVKSDQESEDRERIRKYYG
jgi:mRNA-degrading endonuclease RelE of RelBE toxin-antitoxin system